MIRSTTTVRGMLFLATGQFALCLLALEMKLVLLSLRLKVNIPEYIQHIGSITALDT